MWKFAEALALALEILQHCGVHLPGTPVGGSFLAQLGAIFGAAFCLTEFTKSSKSLAATIRRSFCELVRQLREFVRELIEAFGGHQ